MRVAITDFVAQSWNGETLSLWQPGQHENWHLDLALPRDAAYFHPNWGAKLLRRASMPPALDPRRIAVCFASSKGWLARLPNWTHDPNWTQSEAPWPFPDGEARDIARLAGAQGPLLCPVAACASGAHALALGAQLLQTKRADVVLAGASEPPQPEIILAAYRNMGALSKSGVMRPFDMRRDGFVPASGGALFVLESEDSARERGAPIHGFLTGTSLHCDAHHMTSMHASGDGIARAIKAALQKAGNPSIDYINAHGTATLNDKIESRAIHAVFGKGVPLSSTKALTGHLLGAAGAIEAAICLRAMHENFAPPTLNLEDADNELGLDYLPLVGKKLKIDATLSLNYGFGGHIGALVLEKS